MAAAIHQREMTDGDMVEAFQAMPVSRTPSPSRSNTSSRSAERAEWWPATPVQPQAERYWTSY